MVSAVGWFVVELHRWLQMLGRAYQLEGVCIWSANIAGSEEEEEVVVVVCCLPFLSVSLAGM